MVDNILLGQTNNRANENALALDDTNEGGREGPESDQPLLPQDVVLEV